MSKNKKVPDELFPFEYVGTGYFRLKGVPVGKNASDAAEDGIGILHGMQAIEYVVDRYRQAMFKAADLLSTSAGPFDEACMLIRKLAGFEDAKPKE